MKLVTANIKDNPDLPNRQVEHDVAAIHGIFGLGATVIGWQEIGEKEDHEAVKKFFRPKAWYHLFPELEIPLTIRKRSFKVLDADFEQTHHGLEHVSPNRYFGWALLKKRYRVGVKPFVVMNTHMVSGAFTPAEKVDKPWRKEKWNVHAEKMGKKIKEFVDKGYDVYLLGDLNRVELPLFHPGQKQLVNHRLDHILYFPANKRHAVKKDAGIYGGFLYTDHSPAWAKVFLVPFRRR